MKNTIHSLWRNIAHNWKAGLTVSLVSIPLSLSLAVACGATPTQGIITAIWAGLFASIFGGSNYNIVGPTGALSGILIVYSLTYGFQSLPFIAIFSGLLILTIYFLHWEKYIIFIPGSVVHGFTLGVAIIICLNQLNFALGITGLEKHPKLILNVLETLQHVSQINVMTLVIFLAGLLYLIFWNKRFSKFPGAIILAFIGILFGYLSSRGYMGEHFTLVTLADNYPDIQNNIVLNIFKDFDFSIFNKQFFIVSVATVVVAVLESLLSGQIAEKETNTRFSKRKEVFGLGIGNLVSGLAGGIPATAALARTSLNIRSRATHRASAAISSIAILVISLLLFPYFRYLPMVTVASILVYVGIYMVQRKHYMRLLQGEKVYFWLSMLVAAITVIEDPIVGVLAGAFIALLIFADDMTGGRAEIMIIRNKKIEGFHSVHDFLKNKIDADTIVYRISGALTYLSGPAHVHFAEKIHDKKFLVLSMRQIHHWDIDGINHLSEIVDILVRNNNNVILSGISSALEHQVKHEEFYKKFLTENKIFSRTHDVIGAYNLLD